MVNFVDLAPTVLSLAGVKPPKHMQGHAFAGKYQQSKPKYMFGFRDRMDERYDFIRTVTDGRYHYIRNFNPHFIYGQYVAYNFVTPSTAAWKRDYLAGELNEAQSAYWQLKPTEELYDLETDPDEVNNLVDSKEHQAILKELRGALYGWCEEIRDVGFLPEGEIHSRSAGTSPYEMGHDDKRYPFPKIFEAADKATHRDEESLGLMVNYLKDSDSAVRYWGAVGLLNRGGIAYAKQADALRACMEDESPYVQIAGAYALAKYGKGEDVRLATDHLLSLTEWNASRPVFVALTALNAVDKLDGKAAHALADIKALPRKNGASPDRRYNGYVNQVLGKVIKDLEE